MGVVYKMAITTTCFVFLGDDSESLDNKFKARQVAEHSLLFSKVMLENQERFIKAPCKKGRRLVCVNHVSKLISEGTFKRRAAINVSFKLLHTFKQLETRLSERTSTEALLECKKNIDNLDESQYMVILPCGETGDLIGGVVCKDTDSAEAKVHNKHRMEGWTSSSLKIVPFGEMQNEPTECSNCGEFNMVLEPCAYCKKTMYCSGICQHRHWVSTHKKDCNRSCLTNRTLQFTA